MDVSYVLRENDDNLVVSDAYREKIYYARDGRLSVYDIYTNYKDGIYSFDSKIDDIKVLKRNVYVFRGNKCDIFNMTYKEIKGTLAMKSLPTKIKKMHGLVALLCANGSIHVIENERLTSIRIYTKSEEVEIADFCSNGVLSFILGKNGEVFRSKDFTTTNRIFMNDPEKILSKCAFYEPFGVELHGERLYILDRNGVHVFKVRERCLEMLYMYKNASIRALHCFEGVFCYGDQLVLLDRIPYLLAEERIHTMLEDKAIGETNVYLLSSYNKQYEGETKASELLKERNPSDRTAELFSKIVFQPNCTVEEYKTKIIDGLKSIYIELDSLNKSFADKSRLVGEKGWAVKRKYNELLGKRRNIENKLEELDEKIASRIKEKDNTENLRLKKAIDELRQRIKARRNSNHENELKMIKLQHNILKEYVEDIYK